MQALLTAGPTVMHNFVSSIAVAKTSIIIITDEYDLGGTVALLPQDYLTMLIVSHVTTNQSTTA